MKMLSNTEECLCKLKYDRSTNFKILEGKREISHIVTKRQCNEIFFFFFFLIKEVIYGSCIQLRKFPKEK